MRSVIRLVSTIIIVLVLAGCTSMRMRKQLKRQLAMGGRYRVQILSFDAEKGKAWVKLWDKTHTGMTETPKCPYKYEGGRWLADPNAVFDMRPALNDIERARIRDSGAD